MAQEHAEQTIRRLLRPMTLTGLRNINRMVVSEIKKVKAKKLREARSALKIGDRVTFKVHAQKPCEGPYAMGPLMIPVKCRGYAVGSVISIARSFAKIKWKGKQIKCRVTGLEKTEHSEDAEWFEEPSIRPKGHPKDVKGYWPTREELIPAVSKK